MQHSMTIIYLYVRNSSALLMLDLQTTIISWASLVIVLLLCSLSFFAIGCVCGKQAKHEIINHDQVQNTQEPVYDDLQVNPISERQGKSFELEKNAAYFPV